MLNVSERKEYALQMAYIEYEDPAGESAKVDALSVIINKCPQKGDAVLHRQIVLKAYGLLEEGNLKNRLENFVSLLEAPDYVQKINTLFQRIRPSLSDATSAYDQEIVTLLQESHERTIELVETRHRVDFEITKKEEENKELKKTLAELEQAVEKAREQSLPDIERYKKSIEELQKKDVKQVKEIDASKAELKALKEKNKVLVEKARQDKAELQAARRALKIHVDEQGNPLDSQLTIAVRNRDDNAIKRLLKDTSVNVDFQDPSGQTALHLAVLYGDEKMVALFSTCNRVNPNLLNNEKKSPLYIAVEKDRADIVKLLLKRKELRVDQKSSTGYSALQSALIWKKWMIARLLLIHACIQVGGEDKTVFDYTDADILERFGIGEEEDFVPILERSHWPRCELNTRISCRKDVLEEILVKVIFYRPDSSTGECKEARKTLIDQLSTIGSINFGRHVQKSHNSCPHKTTNGSLLMRAVCKEDALLVKALLPHMTREEINYININHDDSVPSEHVLSWALRVNHWKKYNEIIETLIKCDKVDINNDGRVSHRSNLRRETWYTPVMCAVSGNDADHFLTLMNERGDVNLYVRGMVRFGGPWGPSSPREMTVEEYAKEYCRLHGRPFYEEHPLFNNSRSSSSTRSSRGSDDDSCAIL